MNIAINGFGRIGRAVFKIMQDRKDLKVVAINDLTDTETLVHLLKHDSAYGPYNKQVKFKKNSLVVGNKEFPVLAEKVPENLPWGKMKVDIVVESTGIFRSKETAASHLKAGAKKVLLSAPPKGSGIKTFVMGVNEAKMKKTDKIISNASCTTNCLAPVTDCVRRHFGIKKAIMTTIHSYTADQRLVDGPHKDLRRARAAGVNMVPTTTGAAIATTDTIPSLKGKFDGMAVRVPTIVGSLCDIVFITNKKVDEKMVNDAFKKDAKLARFKNFLTVSEDPLVSTDIIGNTASNIIDLSLTKVIGGDLLKVIAWYDNEWGYSSRMVDMIDYINKKKLI